MHTEGLNLGGFYVLKGLDQVVRAFYEQRISGSIRNQNTLAQG